MPVATAPPDARVLVDEILTQAVARRASDVHLEPTAGGYEVRYRIDGLLETAATHDSSMGRSIVGRFMVLAHLLTYRLDIPQEGRLTVPRPDAPDAPHLDLRVSVIPTTHGLRAAVRLPAELIQPHRLEQLGLPDNVVDGLRR